MFFSSLQPYQIFTSHWVRMSVKIVSLCLGKWKVIQVEATNLLSKLKNSMSLRTQTSKELRKKSIKTQPELPSLIWSQEPHIQQPSELLILIRRTMVDLQPAVFSPQVSILNLWFVVKSQISHSRFFQSRNSLLKYKPVIC